MAALPLVVIMHFCPAEQKARSPVVRHGIARSGLCAENGAMVAALGALVVARGHAPSALDVRAISSMPVTTVLVGA